MTSSNGSWIPEFIHLRDKRPGFFHNLIGLLPRILTNTEKSWLDQKRRLKKFKSLCRTLNHLVARGTAKTFLLFTRISTTKRELFARGKQF